MCKFCNGDHNTQEPLRDIEGNGVKSPILTVIVKDKKLSVIEYGLPIKESFYAIQNCPMCGRPL